MPPEHRPVCRAAGGRSGPRPSEPESPEAHAYRDRPEAGAARRWRRDPSLVEPEDGDEARRAGADEVDRRGSNVRRSGVQAKRDGQELAQCRREEDRPVRCGDVHGKRGIDEFREPPRAYPEGRAGGGPPATINASTTRRSPAATRAVSAVASAHWPSGQAAFSTLQPATIRPLEALNAASTGKPE